MQKEKQKGITLVALVVTIVVLLILAGVSISLVLGENGLISNAKEAKAKTQIAENDEQEYMENMTDWITQTIANLPKTEETKPYMPNSDFFVVDGTNLNNGLVIQDVSGNQYVWVEVPMTKEVYPTVGLNITNFDDDIYTQIENDLHNYTNTYRNNTKFTDVWYKDISKSDDWYTEQQYNELKQKMLRSIYENGGFWIGRYEAGIEESKNRTSNTTEPNEKPQTKQNLCPYTYVTRTQAKKLAEMDQYVDNGKKWNKGLMFGIQWDLMLKFIEVKNIEKDTNIIAKLNSNSKLIGNYRDSEYTLNRGKYAKRGNFSMWYNYTEDLAGIVINRSKIPQSSGENSILLTTGASDQNSLMNIFDIAGNVYEWTLEYTADTTAPCANRGGFHYDSGVYGHAAYRYQNNTALSNGNVGFRIVIF